MKWTGTIVLLVAFCAVANLWSSSWSLLRSEHFTVHYQQPDAKLARFLLNEAEELRIEFSNDIPVVRVPPVSIYLASTWRDYQALHEGATVPAWSVGTADSRTGRIVLLAPRAVTNGSTDIAKVLHHEYGHLIVRAVLGVHDAPRWFEEGLVMLHSRQWSLFMTYTLARAVVTDRLLPMARLHYGFPAARPDAELAYAQSFSFVAFIKASFGPNALPRILGGLGQGLSLDASLRVATGSGLSDLERRWRKHLRKRYTWISVAGSFFSLWFLASLLFIIGYWRKRKRTRAILRRWEDEERLLAPPLSTGPPDEFR
jgi:hypothetical protein